MSSFLCIVADIPGLIEGAHRNRGLGFSFLRHIERCPCIVYVVDLAARSDPVLQFVTLWDELEKYEPGLSRRPHIVLGNKVDLPGANENAARLQEFLNESGEHRETSNLLTVSAKRLLNIDVLLRRLRELFDQHRTP